ncbi:MULTISPECIES: DUF421 domain-containing protein [Bacillus]|uniref:YetF C-terminal domain-containing protein n=1 Tax=Bacillus amyloliquefaciens (strain Y2) TaxID=1155777 RepID=I2C8F0_BACAY|nr:MULTISPECIES: DUF421 domain-containing protein [Bacillus]AFJ62924.1 conserved hypothetical protein YrbG [Bacillus velezensis YAU B9601-Y2]AJE79487.1 membrane protein [Bacillus sp. BH072]AMQ74941.1 membrane protein [Bacillus amyloliquefaciens UMAF6614]ATU27592.1 hypothetical protein BMJ37_12800 [Bacillus velezensis]AUG36807.1 DUF421 domain-containing protein [Bacillus velezensis]
MEDIIIITFRTIVLYFIILVIFRLMGKREIGELSILDLVVSIMIAEIAVLAIENVKDKLLHTIVPIVVLMIIQVSLAFISLKSQKIRQLLDGKPTIIIKQGKIDERAMRSQRYNFDDLLMQLRENNIDRISDVSYAILESSGKLSIVKKKTNKDKQMETSLIVDGVIQNEHLDRIGKDKHWLEKNLAKRGYRDLSVISFCTFTDGAFFIDLKDEKGEP